jgi:hypothetical protein
MALTVTVVALGGTTIKSGPGNGSPVGHMEGKGEEVMVDMTYYVLSRNGKTIPWLVPAIIHHNSQGIGDSPWTLNWHVVLPGSVRWSSDRHISVRPENTHEMLNVLKQSTKVLLTL